MLLEVTMHSQPLSLSLNIAMADHFLVRQLSESHLLPVAYWAGGPLLPDQGEQTSSIYMPFLIPRLCSLVRW